jgi:hypothetical protein
VLVGTLCCLLIAATSGHWILSIFTILGCHMCLSCFLQLFSRPRLMRLLFFFALLIAAAELRKFRKAVWLTKHRLKLTVLSWVCFSLKMFVALVIAPMLLSRIEQFQEVLGDSFSVHYYPASVPDELCSLKWLPSLSLECAPSLPTWRSFTVPKS